MIHGRPSLSSLTRTLSDVCMGREPADLLITGGRLVNVHTREVHDGVDVVDLSPAEVRDPVALAVPPGIEGVDGEPGREVLREDREPGLAVPPDQAVREHHGGEVRAGLPEPGSLEADAIVGRDGEGLGGHPPVVGRDLLDGRHRRSSVPGPEPTR